MIPSPLNNWCLLLWSRLRLEISASYPSRVHIFNPSFGHGHSRGLGHGVTVGTTCLLYPTLIILVLHYIILYFMSNVYKVLISV